MAKKKNEALKSLEKEVARLRKQNDKLAEAIEKSREDQAAAYKELRSLLEERLAVQPAASGDQEAGLRDGDERPKVTQTARRRAEDLGIDLANVRGSGSRGRILVTDVEAVANAR
jgi:pyruvate/2-oxoglutarate dehydrogenase complex dihydrolipoamide acyltransferase (E2) component